LAKINTEDSDLISTPSYWNAAKSFLMINWMYQEKKLKIKLFFRG